ncbi:MAG: hypothetical protein IPK12_23995, partial [Gemmatimonadetes bacterium]|nr:hypothetical protein [Gemmatimonadota bacterium]
MKIDLLGNRSLAVIRDAIRQGAGWHRHRHRLHLEATPRTTPPPAKLFRTGQTMGVFYTEPRRASSAPSRRRRLRAAGAQH